MTKRAVFSLVTAVATLTMASAAFAAWVGDQTGPGAARARNVGVPTTVTASATSASAIRVAWTAPAAPSATPERYVVRRVTPSSATVCTTTALSCDDTGLSGSTTYSYTVQSVLGTSWTSSQSAPASATTPAGPNFLVTVPAGNQTAGTAFTVTLAARNGTTTDTSYTGAHTVVFSGAGASPNGTAPTYPSTVTFSAGVGSASVTLVKAETAPLVATEASRTGSTPVTVAAAATALSFTNNSSPTCASTVTLAAGATFTSKVSRPATDAYGNPSTSNPVTVDLAVAPQKGTLSPTSLTISAGARESTGGFTFTQSSPAANVTITASASGFTDATCQVKK